MFQKYLVHFTCLDTLDTVALIQLWLLIHLYWWPLEVLLNLCCEIFMEIQKFMYVTSAEFDVIWPCAHLLKVQVQHVIIVGTNLAKNSILLWKRRIRQTALYLSLSSFHDALIWWLEKSWPGLIRHNLRNVIYGTVYAKFYSIFCQVIQ